MDFSNASVWWVAAGVAVAAELATGTFYLLMIALGLAAGAIAAHLGLARAGAVRRRGRVGGGATALWHWRRTARAGAAPADGARPRRQPRHRRARPRRRVGRRPHRARAATAARAGRRACSPGAPPAPGEHVVAAVEGNWLVLAPALAALTDQPRATTWNRRSRWAWRSSSPSIAAIFIFQTFKIVPQQHAWVVERLGKYDRTLDAGPRASSCPFIERVAYKHSLKEVPLDVPSQVCITRDNTQLQVDGIIYFQVTDPMRASYGSSNYIAAITQLAQTLLRSVIGKMELDRTFEERDHINLSVVAALDEAAHNWGVKVLRYEIKDLTPPAAILHAMQAQITAEREKRALIAASEGRKQEQINIATGEREAYIARSEGQRQAEINKAQGDAAAIVAVAEATADAIRKVAEAIRQPGGEQAVQLKVAQQAVDAFAQLAQKNNTMIVPGNLSRGRRA